MNRFYKRYKNRKLMLIAALIGVCALSISACSNNAETHDMNSAIVQTSDTASDDNQAIREQNEKNTSSEKCSAETHNVLFRDPDGNLISSQKVNDGDAADAPLPPKKNGFVFQNWDTSFDEVTSDIVVEPVYKRLTELPRFTVERVSARKGDKDIGVSVSIENNPGIASVGLDIHYDNERLKLKDIIYDFDTLTQCYTVPFNPSSAASCIVAINGTSNFFSDGVIATLHFELQSDETCEYPIIISYDPENVYNIQEENIDFEIDNGLISVK